jgi:hypothetical protein
MSALTPIRLQAMADRLRARSGWLSYDPKIKGAPSSAQMKKTGCAARWLRYAALASCDRLDSARPLRSAHHASGAARDGFSNG